MPERFTLTQEHIDMLNNRVEIDARFEEFMADSLAARESMRAEINKNTQTIGESKKRRDEGAGPYTVNMDVSKLGTVFRYAGHDLLLRW